MKKNTKRKFKGLSALALTSVLFLAACSGTGATEREGSSSNSESEATSTVDENATGEGQEITFWHGMGGGAGEAVDELVSRFNEQNELDITVKAEYQGSYDDTITKLKSASLGNVGADLVQIYEIGTSYMMDSGLITPMQDLITANDYDISQIEPNIAAFYTVDEQLYSMPFNSSTPITYYNKDMFEAAGIEAVPETLSQIAEFQEALETEGGADMAISLQIYGWFVEQFIAKQGGDYANNADGREDIATEVAFNENDEMTKLLTEWNNLYEAGAAPNVGRTGGQPEFVAGQSAMTFGSTASLKTILNEVDGKFEVGTAYLPKVSAEDEGGVSIGGASLWAIDNEDAEKAQATWEFVEFLIAPESQAYWNQQTGYFPITTAAHEEELFKENMAEFPQFQTAIDQLHDATPKDQGALLGVFPEARQIIETEIENMLNNDVTPEDTAAAMTEQINASIENYNLVNN